jgi:hypothetical protein
LIVNYILSSQNLFPNPFHLYLKSNYVFHRKSLVFFHFEINKVIYKYFIILNSNYILKNISSLNNQREAIIKNSYDQKYQFFQFLIYYLDLKNLNQIPKFRIHLNFIKFSEKNKLELPIYYSPIY